LIVPLIFTLVILRYSNNFTLNAVTKAKILFALSTSNIRATVQLKCIVN